MFVGTNNSVILRKTNSHFFLEKTGNVDFRAPDYAVLAAVGKSNISIDESNINHR